MNKNQSPQNASEILKNMHDFIQEDEQEIQSMSLSEIVCELKEEGIDTAKLIKEVSNLFKKITAREDLNKAREKRKELLGKFKDATSDLTPHDTKVRQDLITNIQYRFNLSGEQALAYCRKFEEASDADLESLLEDFKFLGEISGK